MSGPNSRGRQRLPEVVASDLLTKIVSGSYERGQMLPPEPVLGSEYGVSRTVVREAVKMLEVKGLVKVSQGRGSIVLPRDEWNSLDPTIVSIQLEQDRSGRIYEELILVRMALESEMAAEAAQRLTPDLEFGLRTAVEGSRAHRNDSDMLTEFDHRFHRLIAEASGNRFGRRIMDALEGPLRASFQLSHRLPLDSDGIDDYHEPILRAIVAHDQDLARQTMREHLSLTWKSLQEGGLFSTTTGARHRTGGR